MVEGKPDTISFLKEFNEAVTLILKGFKQLLKKVLHFLVSRPTSVGGLVWDEMDDGLDA
jgi:hypothetical protein